MCIRDRDLPFTFFTNLFVVVATPETNPKKSDYSDEEVWKHWVKAGWIPKGWEDAIDLELFPSFVDYDRTFQYHIQDNVRDDGRTFREHYPVHPNKDEHDIWAKQIQKEIEAL